MELEWQGSNRWFKGVPKVIDLVKKLLTAEHNEGLIPALECFLKGLSRKALGEGEKLIPFGDNLARGSFADAEDACDAMTPSLRSDANVRRRCASGRHCKHRS